MKTFEKIRFSTKGFYWFVTYTQFAAMLMGSAIMKGQAVTSLDWTEAAWVIVKCAFWSMVFSLWICVAIYYLMDAIAKKDSKEESAE